MSPGRVPRGSNPPRLDEMNARSLKTSPSALGRVGEPDDHTLVVDRHRCVPRLPAKVADVDRPALRSGAPTSAQPTTCPRLFAPVANPWVPPSVSSALI